MAHRLSLCFTLFCTWSDFSPFLDVFSDYDRALCSMKVTWFNLPKFACCAYVSFQVCPMHTTKNASSQLQVQCFSSFSVIFDLILIAVIVLYFVVLRVLMCTIFNLQATDRQIFPHFNFLQIFEFFLAHWNNAGQIRSFSPSFKLKFNFFIENKLGNGYK